MKSLSLFIDSSQYLQFGILDESFRWIELKEIKNRKGSAIMHGEIYELLKKYKMSILDVKNIFLGNGPGSYTGIRLGEGITQILKYEEIKICSFYTFEIPFFSGIHEGSWCVNAFKNEFFIHEWKNLDISQQLISFDQFKNYTPKKGKLFYSGLNLLEKKMVNTIELIRSCSQQIFLNIYNRNQHLPPFYFRSIEREFKRIIN